MAKVTLLMFLSIYNGQPECEYKSDCGPMSGAQTNEAPVKYAINRLAKDGNKIARIIAITTEKAKETALDMFTNSINVVSPDTEIIPIYIKDDESATNLLEKTLGELIPLDKDESVVMETTGGFRNAANFLSLVSRFLDLNGTKILFSTYADLYSKQVMDTLESDELHNLIEAVSVFTTTSNPELLIDRVTLRQIPNAQALTNALNDYYEMLLCCKIGQYEEIVKNLQENLNKLLNAEYEAYDVSGLLFRDILRQTLMKKTPFIFEKDITKSLKTFVVWCLDNNYIAQAVIILMEKFIGEQNVGRNDIFDRINSYRNHIAHADWRDMPDVKATYIKEDVIKALEKLKEHNAITDRSL